MPLTIECGKGPWIWFDSKSNASEMQKNIVPWLIAFKGMSYAKTIKLDILRDMIVATCDKHKLLRTHMSAQNAASAYPLL